MASQPGPSSSATSTIEIGSFVRSIHPYKDTWELRKGALAPVISQFLKQDCNKGVVYITGKRINRGGGFGLEAPCIFQLCSPEAYLRRLKELVDAAGGTASDLIKEDPDTRSQPAWWFFRCKLTVRIERFIVILNVLLRQHLLSALWNMGVSAFQGFQLYINICGIHSGPWRTFVLS